jgi:tRNA-specific 2-thiouridylase
MSGGVDSAVAALLLAEQGFDVFGVTLKLFCYGDADAAATDRSCCSLDAIDDARRSARQIGIRHTVIDFSEDFRAAVLDRFEADYVGGRTPSPCVACNSEIKFNRFLDRARAMGADFVATGHYARVVAGAEGGLALLAGADAAKDQSYFLWGIRRETLARVLLPVGGLTKSEVRAHARRAELPVAEKRESMDICFVPGGDYGEHLERSAARRDAEGSGGARGDGAVAGAAHAAALDDRRAAALAPGPIVDTGGREIGEHRGYARYTVGQRKGLGLASDRRLYVTAIDPATRAITVGGDADLCAAGCEAEEANFFVDLAEHGTLRARARVRHRHEPVGCSIAREPAGRVRVAFDVPQRAVTPGQSIVFYGGERVLGGAVISRSTPRS